MGKQEVLKRANVTSLVYQRACQKFSTQLQPFGTNWICLANSSAFLSILHIFTFLCWAEQEKEFQLNCLSRGDRGFHLKHMIYSQ